MQIAENEQGERAGYLDVLFRVKAGIYEDCDRGNISWTSLKTKTK